MKSKLRILIVLFIALFAFLSGVELLARVSYGLALVLVLGYVWARVSTRSVEAHVDRSASRLQVGQWLREDVTLRNKGLLPRIMLEVRGNGDMPWHLNSRVVSLLPGGSCRWTAESQCLLRGHYTLAPLTVTGEDLFGFFSHRRSVGKEGALVIYPATLDLPDFLHFSGDAQGSRLSRVRGAHVPPNVSGIRDYIPGDTLKNIHWPSTLRNNRLIVKDFRQDSSEDVWIVLDLCQAAQAGTGMESTEEYGVTVAASVARKCLDANRSLGFVAWGDSRYLVHAQRGAHHLWRVLNVLSRAKATGASPLGALVSASKGCFGVNSTVVIITPSPDAFQVAASCSGRGLRVVVIKLDAASFAGHAAPPAGAPHTNGFDTYLIRKGDNIPAALGAVSGGPSGESKGRGREWAQTSNRSPR